MANGIQRESHEVQAHGDVESSVPLLDRLGLGLARALAPILRAWGVDTERFVALLDMRLKLGRRRTRSGRPAGTKGQMVTFFVAMMSGVVAAGASSIEATQMGSMTLGLTVIWLMVGLFQALDIGPLLFDPAESHVVLPTPTEARTVYCARMAHGLWGQGWILAGVWIPLAVYWVVYRGSILAALVAGMGVLGLALTSFCMLVSLFLFLARGREAARVQGMAVYVQMGLLATFYTLLQTMGANPREVLQHGGLEFGVWMVAFPPAWYAGGADLARGAMGWMPWTLGTLAFVGPGLGLLATLRLVRQIHLSGAAAGGAGRVQAGGPRGLWVAKLAKRLRLAPIERAGFELTGHLAGREHAFRQRTWPSLVYPVVFGVGTLVRNPEMGLGMAGIWVLMPAILLPAILIHARYTRDPGAQWILEAAPVPRPSLFLAGTRRLFLLLVAVLPALLFAAVWAAVAPIEQLPTIVGTLALGWAMATWFSVWIEHRLPFTEAVPAHTRPEGLRYVLVATLIGGVAFLVTLVFRLGDGATWATAALAFALGCLGWRQLGRPSSRRDAAIRFARIRL